MGCIHQFSLNISFKAVKLLIPPSRDSKALTWRSDERFGVKKMRANNVNTITKTSISPKAIRAHIAGCHESHRNITALQSSIRLERNQIFVSCGLHFFSLFLFFFLPFPVYSIPTYTNFPPVLQAGDTVLSISEAWHTMDCGIISTGL